MPLDHWFALTQPSLKMKIVVTQVLEEAPTSIGIDWAIELARDGVFTSLQQTISKPLLLRQKRFRVRGCY
jgi:hypothetical protein